MNGIDNGFDGISWNIKWDLMWLDGINHNVFCLKHRLKFTVVMHFGLLASFLGPRPTLSWRKVGMILNWPPTMEIYLWEMWKRFTSCHGGIFFLLPWRHQFREKTGRSRMDFIFHFGSCGRACRHHSWKTASHASKRVRLKPKFVCWLGVCVCIYNYIYIYILTMDLYVLCIYIYIDGN